MDLYNFVRLSHIFTGKTLLLLFVSSLSVPVVAFSFVTFTKTWLHTEYNLFPEEIDFFIQLIIWGITFIVVKSIPHWHKHVVPFIKGKFTQGDKYEINFGTNEDRFKREWEAQGNPVLIAEGVVATNTNSGFLLKPKWLWSGRVWKDFEASIDVDFKKQRKRINRQLYEDNDKKIKERDITSIRYKKLIGIIFRARDFENYFLLEVWKIDGWLVIRPHTRIEGNWDAPVLNPDSNSYAFASNIDQLTLTLKVKGDKATLQVNSDVNNLLVWVLPAHYEINLSQHSQINQGDLKQANVRKISFRLKAGRFGFRNYGDEAAIVKRLDIKPI